MSRAKSLRCRCRRLPEAAMTVPLVNAEGKRGANKYLFSPICNAPSNYLMSMEAPEEEDLAYGEVWAIGDDLIITSRPFTVTTTINSLAVGGVIVEARWTDVDGLFFKYTNMNPVQPHAGAAMELVDYDTTTTVTFHDYVCLRPAVSGGGGGLDCAACFSVDGMTFPPPYDFLFLVEPESMGGTTEAGPDPSVVAASECSCRDFSRSMAGLGCVYQELRTQCHDMTIGYGLPLAVALEPIDSSSAKIHYGRSDSGLYGNMWWRITDRSACDIALNGGTFSLPYQGVDGTGCENNGAVSVTVIPLTENGEPRTAAPCGELYCGGVSQWYLRRKCHDGTSAYYYWEQASDQCKGLCSEDGCRPTEPFALPTERVTDATATSEGYIAGLDMLFDGGCGCDDPPAEPACETGCSVWTLRRTFCFQADNVDYHIYYWDPVNSSCDGACGSETCTAQPPYPLETEAVDEATATALGYIDALNEVDNTGTCACDDAYVPPECPDGTGACCYCDEMTNNVLCVDGVTQAECIALSGQWHAGDTCAGFGSEPSESCVPCFGDECAGGIC